MVHPLPTSQPPSCQPCCTFQIQRDAANGPIVGLSSPNKLWNQHIHNFFESIIQKSTPWPFQNYPGIALTRSRHDETNGNVQQLALICPPSVGVDTISDHFRPIFRHQGQCLSTHCCLWGWVGPCAATWCSGCVHRSPQLATAASESVIVETPHRRHFGTFSPVLTLI